MKIFELFATVSRLLPGLGRDCPCAAHESQMGDPMAAVSDFTGCMLHQQIVGEVERLHGDRLAEQVEQLGWTV